MPPSSLKAFDEIDNFPNLADLGSFFLRNLAVEFFFNSHDQFNSVEGVSTKIVDEGGFGSYLIGVNSELFDDQFLDFVIVESSVCSESRRSRGESSGAGNKSKGDKRLEHD